MFLGEHRRAGILAAQQGTEDGVRGQALGPDGLVEVLEHRQSREREVREGHVTPDGPAASPLAHLIPNSRQIALGSLVLDEIRQLDAEIAIQSFR